MVRLGGKSGKGVSGKGLRSTRRARTQLVPSQSFPTGPSDDGSSDRDEEELEEVPDSWSFTIAQLDSREPRAKPLDSTALNMDFDMHVDPSQSNHNSAGGSQRRGFTVDDASPRPEHAQSSSREAASSAGV